MAAAAAAAIAANANVQAADETVDQLREKLDLLRQIHQIQNNIANPTQPVMKHVKVPEGSYHMSQTEFRTYKRDCLSYQTLTRYRDAQIVMQIRLNMDNDLKRVIDANHPDVTTP